MHQALYLFFEWLQKGNIIGKRVKNMSLVLYNEKALMISTLFKNHTNK